MGALTVNIPDALRGFSAKSRRKIHVLAVLCAVWTLIFLTFAPSGFADDKIPQDEYEAALMDSYAGVFAGAEVSDEQVSSFVTCLSNTTYNDLSAETVRALTEGNLDYEVSGEEADIFLGSVQTCIADNDLSNVVITPESEGDNSGGDDVSVVETSDSELPETSTEESSSYLLPLATGLTLLAIIALAFYLLMRSKTRDAQEMEIDGSTES